MDSLHRTDHPMSEDEWCFRVSTPGTERVMTTPSSQGKELATVGWVPVNAEGGATSLNLVRGVPSKIVISDANMEPITGLQCSRKYVQTPSSMQSGSSWFMLGMRGWQKLRQPLHRTPS